MCCLSGKSTGGNPKFSEFYSGIFVLDFGYIRLLGSLSRRVKYGKYCIVYLDQHGMICMLNK